MAPKLLVDHDRCLIFPDYGEAGARPDIVSIFFTSDSMAELADAPKAWCDEMGIPQPLVGMAVGLYIVEFANSADAVAFKLRWV